MQRPRGEHTASLRNWKWFIMPGAQSLRQQEIGGRSLVIGTPLSFKMCILESSLQLPLQYG